MKALVFERFGDPKEVLEVRDVPLPQPDAGMVRVRMLASPLNPSDLLVVRGEYGKRPPLPATPGFEGVGVVEAAGPGLLGRMRIGRRVAVLNGKGGNWQEQVILPSRQVVPMPRAVPDEQAATFFVNPASAVIMTRTVLRIPRGAWLLQTAAGSALGKMVISLGKHFGFRTINVVRRPEQAEELRRLGGDATICTASESIEERVNALTEGKGVPFAIDAVGGQVGSAAAASLGKGGRMLVYGTLSEEALSVHPRVLMVGRKRIEGFWLSEWVQSRNPLALLRLFRQITQLMRLNVLHTDIAKSYSLEDYRAAVEHAARAGHSGKVLFRMGSR
jgi:NADPH:quinone reductase-like Zn-dependent oxidoreductase